jgi:hypothetical protein
MLVPGKKGSTYGGISGGQEGRRGEPDTEPRRLRTEAAANGPSFFSAEEISA